MLRKAFVAGIGMSAFVALCSSAGTHTVVAASQVPFAAQFSGAITFSPTASGFPVHVSGVGDASHLGRSSNSGTVVLLNEINSDCPTTGFVVLNTQTITAANGDQIFLSITDHPCPAGGPGLFSGTDPYTITGGTGRFTGATGQGTFAGNGDFNTNTFTYIFSGQISAPNQG